MANPIRFDDGAAYERYMGAWSQRVGAVFLQWLSPGRGLRWLDVGCGNGAFTQLIVDRCAPASVTGIDPADGALAFARARFAPGVARFLQGNAIDLPLPDRSVDAAVMPLVIFFVPDPAKGVAEMARVVRAGGVVSAYGWDLLGGGFPYDALQAEMRAMGVDVPMPPSPGASAVEALLALWAGAGLQEIQPLQIEVERRYAGFDDYWDTILGGPSVKAALAGMRPEEISQLKERMRARLPADTSGGISVRARANAVRGCVSP